MVGDQDGMMATPAHLEDEISQGCAKMEDFDDFVLEEVIFGAPVIFLHPCTTHENMRKFEVWKTKRQEKWNRVSNRCR